MNRRELLAGIALGTAGFIVNLFKLPLFFDVDFLFGSIFSMFALLRFGPATGLLAAAIASGCTWIHWHHPWGMIIFTSEALCAGWLMNRRRMGLIVGDIIFWFSGGLLLIWFFFSILMDFTANAALLIALKQAINGIFNTLLAEILFLFVWSRSGSKQLPSIGRRLRITMMGLVLVPSFLLAYADINGQFKDQLTILQHDTLRTAEIGQLTLANWITEERHKIHAIANLIGDPSKASRDEMQRLVEKSHAAHTDSFRIGVIDNRQITRAFSPQHDENGKSTIGIWLGDRPYIAGLNNPRHPTVYETFMGRIGKPGPRMIIMTPCMTANQYQGAVFSVIMLDYPASLLRGIVSKQEINLTLLDRQRRVIASTRTDIKALQPFTLPKGGKLLPAENGISQWIPNPQPGIAAMKRWNGSFYISEVEIDPESGFRLVAEAPLLPKLVIINNRTSFIFGILALLALILAGLSRYFSKRLLNPISTLSRITSQLQLKIAQGELISWPAAKVKEEQELQDNFRLMENALQESFMKLTVINEGLEASIAARTVELQKAMESAEASAQAMSQSEEKVRLLLNSTAEAIYGIDLQGQCTFANPSCLRILGYEDQEQLLGQNMHWLIHHTRPDGTPFPVEECRIFLAFREGTRVYVDDEVLWRSDGSSFPAEYWSHPQMMAGKITGAVVTFNDISERLLAQTQLAAKQEQLETLNQTLQQHVAEAVNELRHKDQVLITQGRQAAMGEMIGNIAHQWRQPLNALAMLISNIQLAQRDRELTDEYMEKSAETANRLIQKMSTTINDFRDFFSPDKRMVPFSARQQIQQAIELVEAAFKNNNINISIETEGDCCLQGFPNEYSQVLLNLFSNARDAIVEARPAHGCINVMLREQGNMGIVTVRDNGGGISQSILDKIFEPYFSTKSRGTGIGLYMSKMIIERNMNGRIEARNIEGGCEFSISTPLAGQNSCLPEERS